MTSVELKLEFKSRPKATLPYAGTILSSKQLWIIIRFSPALVSTGAFLLQAKYNTLCTEMKNLQNPEMGMS
jgi:hypothetical protein